MHLVNVSAAVFGTPAELPSTALASDYVPAYLIARTPCLKVPSRLQRFDDILEGARCRARGADRRPY